MSWNLSHLQNSISTATKRQGTTSQAAEKLEIKPALYQGTTSVVPQMHDNESRALASILFT
jgi:hypothetical protein